MTFLPLVLCPTSVSVPREPMPMLCHGPEQGRTLPWAGGCCHPRAAAALCQGRALSPWRCYKYRSGAISIPAPAGLEARPPRCLKLFLAHLDSFHPASSAASPEQVCRVRAARVAEGVGCCMPWFASAQPRCRWVLPGDAVSRARGDCAPCPLLLGSGCPRRLCFGTVVDRCRAVMPGRCESRWACAGGAAEAAQQPVVWLGLGVRGCWESGHSTGAFGGQAGFSRSRLSPPCPSSAPPASRSSCGGEGGKLTFSSVPLEMSPMDPVGCARGGP